MWHAGVQPKRFFDDSVKVFHLVQVHHCGRAVRTFKNVLQFFICLVLERVSSYISVFRAFLVSVSFQKVRSIHFKTLHGHKIQCTRTISSGRWTNPANEICGRNLKYVWRHFVRSNKPTVGSFFNYCPFCCVFLLPVHQGSFLVGRVPRRWQHACISIRTQTNRYLIVYLLPFLLCFPVICTS